MKRSIEGSIYQSKDKKGWFARLQYNDNEGRRREKKRICKSHALAKAKIDELRLEIEKELSDRKTYEQMDAYYRKEYVHAAKFVGGKKVSGFRQDLRNVNYYLDVALQFFGDRYIDEITYADLKEYKKHVESIPTKHGRERSVSDVNHFLKRLRRLFMVAVEQGWLNVNPFDRGGALIIESFEDQRTRVLTYEEESRLLAACDKWRKHLIPIVIFGIETGMRRGEIQSLRWSSVNLERRFVKVESQNSKTLKSRLVPLSGRAAEVLTNIWENSRHAPFELVFGCSDFKKSFNTAAAKAGLDDVHFHDLRHTAITRWLEKGLSIADAMKASGHSQMRTFLRYVNQTEISVYETALKLDQHRPTLRLEKAA